MDYKNVFDIGGYSFGSGEVAVAILLAIWELAWKGFGLWKAATNKQLGWFIGILLLNTLGILPILYIYVFSPKTENKN